MPPQTIPARSIARPLLETLAFQPFQGRVQGRFARACNLVDETGRVITLALPEIGQVPFGVVIPATPGLFDSLTERESAQADVNGLTVGHWQIDLRPAHRWEARLPFPGQPVQLTPLQAHILSACAAWPSTQGETPLAKNLYRRVNQATLQLSQTLAESSSTLPPQKIPHLTAAVESLAGLGDGLTPAGDDYLVGLMAALWLEGRAHWLPLIAASSAPRTTQLSAAFLWAAGRGDFSQPWHVLAQTLTAADAEAFSRAVQHLAAVGASSGRAGLAGFASAMLNLTDLKG